VQGILGMLKAAWRWKIGNPTTAMKQFGFTVQFEIPM